MTPQTNDFLGSVSCIIIAVLLLIFVLSMVRGSKGIVRQRPFASVRKDNDHYVLHIEGDVSGLEKEINHIVHVESWEHVGRNEWDIHLNHRNGKGDAQYVAEAINKAENL